MTEPSLAVLAKELEHIREILSLKEDALKLQAREYERRLDALNNEAVRLDKNNAEKVSVQTWEYGHRELNVKLDSKFDIFNTRLVTVERNIWMATGGLATVWIVFKILEHFAVK